MGKRRILVIAGSDSSGGAGLEADQKVMAAHSCYAMTATTALTAQNTQGVSDIHYVPPEFVVKQIDACASDIGIDVVKIGMLASAKTVGAVASALRKHGNPATVLDPVTVSTSGAQLLPDEAVCNLLTLLLPLITILTPNIPEAILLLQKAGLETPRIDSVDELVSIARSIHKLGPQWVLVKGGHLPFTKDGHVSRREDDRHTVVDILCGGKGTEEKIILYESNYQSSTNTHGTGCSLASAIACGIALSESPVPTKNMPDVVEMACKYIEAGIHVNPGLGHGNGPIGHFHSLSLQPPPSFQSSLRRSQYQSKARA